MPIDVHSRRRFLQFLAASPLLAATDLAAMAAEAPSRLPDPMIWAPRSLDKLIASPKEAINVFDFEPVAAKNIPPAHFGYMTGGVNDDVTLRANREASRNSSCGRGVWSTSARSTCRPRFSA